MLSDFKLHVIAAPDGVADSRREFRTPTLRNLRHTAPYMHNGSLRTLRDVSIFYEALADAVSETLDGGDTTTQPRLDPLLKHLNLNADDFPALEAFLDALNDEAYDQTIPAEVPSGLPVIQ
jgi:cytochrome c peroxidase